MTKNRLIEQAETAFKSIATDKKLVAHGVFLLALHVAGILLFYRFVPEYDNIPHFWFGYVLSEYSSRGAASIGLQLRLQGGFQKHGWATASFGHSDLLVRLVGFLLIGGLVWESAELFFSPFFGIEPNSFFSFPITLRNIDGALDASVGAVGAIVAYVIGHSKRIDKEWGGQLMLLRWSHGGKRRSHS